MVYKVGMAANSLLKIGLLITLVLQTTSCVLLLRYSRHGATFDGSERYLISTTIVSSEIIKVLTSIIILYYQSSRNLKNLFILLRVELITKWEEAIKSAVPAVAYTLQNNLLFVALSHLDSVTYQVTYQLKIFVTAIFSVLMLNKKLSIFQWISLVMLIFGVVLIQLPDSFDVDNDNHTRTNDLIGFVSVLISCFLSGFTGVYFEKILKKGQQSLWIRNFQLSLVSSILAALNAFTQDYDPIRKAGFFQGYSTLTWIVILIHAFGGFIVAGVMKYADNILKGFATSISIVLSTILSYYVMDDFQPQPYFWIGGPTVLMAVMLYSL